MSILHVSRNRRPLAPDNYNRHTETWDFTRNKKKTKQKLNSRTDRLMGINKTRDKHTIHFGIILFRHNIAKTNLNFFHWLTDPTSNRNLGLSWRYSVWEMLHILAEQASHSQHVANTNKIWMTRPLFVLSSTFLPYYSTNYQQNCNSLTFFIVILN